MMVTFQCRNPKLLLGSLSLFLLTNLVPLTLSASVTSPAKELSSGWPSIDQIYHSCISSATSLETINDGITTRRLCDPDGILSKEDAKIIEEEVLLFEKSHSICRTEKERDVNEEKGNGDIQMAIVVVTEMDLSSPTSSVQFSTMNEAAEFHATTLHNMFGVGNVFSASEMENKNCKASSSFLSSSSTEVSTGILVFLSILDRSIYISTSNGVQHILNSQRLDDVIDNMKIHFREKDYKEGIRTSITLMGDYFEKGMPSFWENYLGELLFVGVFAFFYGFQLRDEIKERKEYAEVHSRLSKLDRDKALVLMGQYECTSCPICLEDFEETSSSDSYSAEKKYIGSDGKPIVILRCGHAFDETCWKDWISKGDNGTVQKCPICKEPVLSPSCTTTIRRRDANEAIARTSEFTNTTISPSTYESERAFRLTRLMARYPRYIRLSQLSRWTNPSYEGRMVNDARLERGYSQNHRSGGGGGHSSGGVHPSSFGGGMSGGGRGGSW